MGFMGTLWGYYCTASADLGLPVAMAGLPGRTTSDFR